MTTTRLLLTGFEPFGDEEVNASQLAVARVEPADLPGIELTRATLPTEFDRSLRALRELLSTHRPDVVVCVGQAGGRAEITPERVAINVDDARIPDNAGQQPIDAPIVAGGPVGYFSTLPIKTIVEVLRREELPAAVSQTAGTFVCNHVFYGLMRSLARRPGVRGGFVHVPITTAQAKDATTPTLSVEALARGLTIVANVSATVREDRRLLGGATH